MCDDLLSGSTDKRQIERLVQYLRVFRADDDLKSYKSFAGVVLVHQVDHPMTKTADFDLALERLDTSDGVSAVVSVNQDGRQNGAIRVISSAVIGKKCLEYVIATVRTEYPQIDIHTEYDLLEAVGTVYSVGGEKW